MRNHVVVDLDSKTYFCANNAVLVDWNNLDPAELEIFITGSDEERSELAEKIGRPVA